MAQQTLREFSYKQVELLKTETIGIGSYGVVCKAKYDDLLCAAKILHQTLVPIEFQILDEDKQHRSPMRRFEQECEFMSAIKHPNIVQYLGRYQEAETGLTVLLMELMDDSLTHFLANPQEPLPLYIQVNLCHDIAVALSFLHSNGIIHRDLSSNNVLLIGNSRAKVTDFGMAKLSDMNLQESVTKCPGTEVYMPPEAVKDKTAQTNKVDCFSFGVLTVQMITREFPKPGERFKEVKTNDPQFPNGTVEVRVSEVERRSNHIGEIAQDHLLRPLALQCLKDRDTDRPSARKICLDVLALKDSPVYIESAENENRSTIETKLSGDVRQFIIQNKKKDDEIQELSELYTDSLLALQETKSAMEAREQEFQELEHQHIENQSHLETTQKAQEEEIQKLRQQLEKEKEENESNYKKLKLADSDLLLRELEIETLKQQLCQEKSASSYEIRRAQTVVRSKEKEIQKLETQLQEATLDAKVKADYSKSTLKTLESNEQIIHSIQARNLELENVLQSRKGLQKLPEATKMETITHAQFTLNWKEAKDAPYTVTTAYNQVPNAVVHGDKAYFNTADFGILSYSISDDTWSQLSTEGIEYSRELRGYSLVVVRNVLTAIGRDYTRTLPHVIQSELARIYRKIHSMEESRGKIKEEVPKWSEIYPSMLTERCYPVAVSTEEVLVVTGGESLSSNSIEVLNLDNRTWNLIADLPPIYPINLSVCGGQLYVFGNDILVCETHQLLHKKSRSNSNVLKKMRRKTDSLAVEWKFVAAQRSTLLVTCFTIQDYLLTICEKSNKVNRYDVESNSWQVISHTINTHNKCFAAVLSDSRVMIVGADSDMVEIASV